LPEAPSKKYSGQRIKRYPELSCEIEEWRHLIEEYCKRMEMDVPYIYTERALVGTFAAAVWRAGSISLEEYSTTKGLRKGRGIRERPGRADLWIMPKVMGKHPHGCIFEAKWIWLDIGRKSSLNDLPSKCKELLRRAREDAKKVREAGKRLGLVFVIPYLSKRWKRDVEQHIERFISQLKKVDADIAWTFPSPKFTEGNHVYPGVAMLMR